MHCIDFLLVNVALPILIDLKSVNSALGSHCIKCYKREYNYRQEDYAVGLFTGGACGELVKAARL